MEGCLMDDYPTSGPAWTLGGQSLFRLTAGGIGAVVEITSTGAIAFSFSATSKLPSFRLAACRLDYS